MSDLNLPVIKDDLPPPRSLSMNGYLKFIEMYLRYLFCRDAYEYWKEKRTVNVRFTLK